MLVAEMYLLRWICNKTREDKYWIERIRRYLGIAPTENKIRKRQLTKYSHVMKTLPTAPIKRCLNMHISGGIDVRVDL